MTENGLEYEVDQRHAEILMRDMGIDESSKGVTTLGVSSIEGEQVQESPAKAVPVDDPNDGQRHTTDSRTTTASQPPTYYTASPLP